MIDSQHSVQTSGSPPKSLLLPVLVATILVVVYIVGFVKPVAASGVIYVNHATTGANNGSSWANAFPTLQDALAVATSGDEIWVAAGVYYPDEGGDQVDNARESTFTLVDGVAIYGGFAGTESSRTARDWDTNRTVLSGDLRQDDGTDATGVVTDTANIVGSNSYNVVTSSYVGNSTILDGITITAGQANGNVDDGGGIFNVTGDTTFAHLTIQGNMVSDDGGGIYNYYGNASYTDITISNNTAQRDGGGIHNHYSSVTYSNVTISNNTAQDDGGGIYNDSGSANYSNVTISNNTAQTYGGGIFNYYGIANYSNVTISNNTAQNEGGGIYTTNDDTSTYANLTVANNTASLGGGLYSASSDATWTNVTIQGNTATNNGGGVYISDGSPVWTNILISGNRSTGTIGGGGVYHASIDAGATFTNTTISGNSTSGSGGGVYNAKGDMLVQNSLIWNNQDSSGTGTANSSLSTGAESGYLDFAYSLVQGHHPTGAGNLDGTLSSNDPLFVAPISPTNAPNTAGDYHVEENSPTIDAGNNSFIPKDLMVDIDGNLRIQNGTVNLGAYEEGSAPSSYTISGNIVDQDGKPIARVMISDGNTINITTDLNGNYIATELVTGTYTLTPTKTEYTFNPVSITVSVPPYSTRQDFTVTPRISTINGTVKDAEGNGLANVIISTTSGLTTTTNNDGSYTFTNLDMGRYTLTPYLKGYGFSPGSHTRYVPADDVPQDFIAHPADPVEIWSASSISGNSGTVAVSGTLAFAGEGGKLNIFDVSIPSSPKFLSSLSLPGYVTGIQIKGSLAYVSDFQEGLQIVDVSDPHNPILKSSTELPQYGMHVDVVGSLAYVADSYDGLHILDVSNPEKPVDIGSYTDITYAADVDVEGDMAYVTNHQGGGLFIIDVSNPISPTLEGTYKVLSDTATSRVQVNGNYAYLAYNSEGLHILDVSTPSQPSLVSNYTVKENAVDVLVDGNFAYVSDSNNGISILDISNVVSPTQVSYYTEQLSNPNQITINESTLYVADHALGVHILDTSVTTAPVHLGHFAFPSSSDSESVVVDGNYAYVGEYEGLLVVDVQDPNHPLSVKTDTSVSSIYDIHLVGDILYLASGYNGITIMDKSLPASPQVVGTFDTPGNAQGIYVQEDIVYVADGDKGLQIIDVQDSSNPTLLGNYIPSGIAESVYVSGDVAYLASKENGLFIIDVSDKQNPTLIHNYIDPTNDSVYDVCVVQDMVYLALFSNGLSILDASDLSNPVQIGNYDTYQYGLGVQVVGSFAYMANSWDGVYVIDISTPNNPTLAKHYDTQGYTSKIAVTDDVLYVADGHGGFEILHQRIDRYTFSGQVVDTNGNPIHDLTLSAGNGITPVTTGSDGTYTFDNIPKGTYTITPTLAGYTFTPASRTVNVPIDATGLNFIASPVINEYSIAGKVRDSDGNPIAGVTISDEDGHSATTDSNGNYTVTNLPTGSYILIPTLAGYTFTPASRTVSVPPDATELNFTASPVIMTGKVVDTEGNTISGVTISDGAGNTATTDSNGNYTFANVLAGEYTLTPQFNGYTFDPINRKVTVPPDATEQDFTIIPKKYTVSGMVSDENGESISGVTMTMNNGSTNRTKSNGTYTITNVLSGTYIITPSLTGYTFTPVSRRITVPPNSLKQNFTATPMTYIVSGSVEDSEGILMSGVTITMSDGSSSITNKSGAYSITNVLSGTYVITPTIPGYTFEPVNRKVLVPPDASGQDFTANETVRQFEVGQDGFNFDNFRYYGADWEHFKKAFPGTKMELPNGERRKGPIRYFESRRYKNVGEGGNCAGFTAASLIHFMNLSESVETDLLNAANRDISPLHAMPNPGTQPFDLGESDIADYIHLYQARQLSWQYNQWWFAQGHDKDTPLEVFNGIQTYTERNEPVAVSIRSDNSGHRMTAYRTEQVGSMGYIYVYDSNWTNDDTRRIEMDMTTGQWSYALSSRLTWSGTSNIRYSPGALNFPASLPYWHNYDKKTMLTADGMTSTNIVTGTNLGIDGAATLLITDREGNKLGFEGDTLVSDIPGAGYLPIYGFHPDVADEPTSGLFFIPEGSDYTVTIEPTASGNYTLTAFADGSVMSLDNIDTTLETNDTVTLSSGVQNVTFDSGTDNNYCYYITLEVSDTNSRDYTSCVSGGSEVTFNLDQNTGKLSVGNDGSQAISVTTTIDQVGADAQKGNVSTNIGAGDTTTVEQDQSGNWVEEPSTDKNFNHTYLPLVRR